METQQTPEMIIITPALKWLAGGFMTVVVAGVIFTAKTVYSTAQDTAIIRVQMQTGYATKEELQALRERVIWLETQQPLLR